MTCSIIIPAYNTGEKIQVLIESIAAQNYKDIEIILVDDASIDDTRFFAEKALKISGLDFRIVANKYNLGVSNARNTGLKLSRGEKIAFVDSDDFIAPNFISRLSEYDADITFCGHVINFPGSEQYIYPGFHDSSEKYILQKTLPPLWSCMYDRAFLFANNLYFYPGCICGEDVEFQIKAFCMARSIKIVNECLYYYVQHNNMSSVMNNKITRYEHNTQAQIRTAIYLQENGSTKLKAFAEDILMPQNIIRQLNIFAMKHDKTGYDKFLNDSKNIDILEKSQKFYIMFRSPEIFFKAFMILHVSDLYYRLRSKW